MVFKLPPYFENFGKRVIKSPKYYFTDTGLLTYLLDIEKVSQVRRDPLLGNIFENLVVLEALKARYNQGLAANLYFFRDSAGHEIDLLFKSGRDLNGIEIRAGATWSRSFKKGLAHFSEKINPLAQQYVVYSGDGLEFSDGLKALPFSRVGEIFDS